MISNRLSKRKDHDFSVFTNLKYDLPASISVFLISIPLSLGIALASGVPLFRD